MVDLGRGGSRSRAAGYRHGLPAAHRQGPAAVSPPGSVGLHHQRIRRCGMARPRNRESGDGRRDHRRPQRGPRHLAPVAKRPSHPLLRASRIRSGHGRNGNASRRAMKLHLVDATFELFRAFYSPGRQMEFAPDGRPVNAVHGLIDSMLSLLREPDVTHLAAATDHVIESWRNDVFSGYKSSVGLPPELLDQFDDAERALRALGIVTWAMVEDEADDAIATAVARFSHAPRVEQIVICSVDKDLAQCVDDGRIVLRDRVGRVTYEQAGVVAKFGVPPASIPDYLALVGDSSDGYPGLPGWGAKSAAAVLAKFGHLESIPADWREWHVNAISAGTLAQTLVREWDSALLFRKLATLRTDISLFDDVEQLRWNGPTAGFAA